MKWGAEGNQHEPTVSVWAGNIASPDELSTELEQLYRHLNLPDSAPDPRVVKERELVPIEELIEPLPLSQAFLTEAVAAAKQKGVARATASVGIYDLPVAHPPQLGSLTFIATFRTKSESAAEYVQEHGTDSAGSNDTEETALLYDACLSGELDEVRRLLQSGADPEGANEVGHTPLMAAATTEHDEVAEQLLASGASVSAATPENGYSPLHWSVLHPPKNVRRVQRIIEAMLKHGADINAQAHDGTTALMNAAWFGSPEIVGLLLARGALLSPTDGQGQTALQLAKKRGHGAVVQLLTNAAQNVRG